MALPSAGGLQPSPSPAPGPSSASLGPPTKKIKRTNFPDWDATMSANKSSVTHTPSGKVSETPTSIGSGRLAASKAVQAQQKLWEQQAAIRALDTALVEDDSDSEYFTSASDGSDDEAAGVAEDGRRPQGMPQAVGSSMSRPQVPGVMKPWRVPPGSESAANLVSVTPVPLPPNISQAQASKPTFENSATGTVIHPTTQTVPASVTADKSSASPAGTGKPTPEGRADSAEDSAYKYLTPNELEAKIRYASLQGSKQGDADTDQLFSDLSTKVGTYGELYTAADGRLYSQLPLPGGKLHSTATLPIPTNYKLHHDEGAQFICPVRDCRKIGSTVAFLVGHFAASHNKTKFNDNLDGTLTAVATYWRGPKFHSPGIIVSRGPPPPGTSPPVEPQTSTYVRRMETLTQATSTMERRHSAPRASIPSPSAQPARLDTDPIRYLRQDMRLQQIVPNRIDVSELKNLPRRRDLPRIWIDHHAGTSMDVILYACALAYIVGDEVKDGDAKCTATRWNTSRLSERCIKLPDTLSSHARDLFCKTASCVGCRYYSYLQRQKNTCDWGPAAQRDTPSDNEVERMQLDPPTRTRVSSTDEGTPAPRGFEADRRRSAPNAGPKTSQRHRRQSRPEMGRTESGLRYSTTFSEGPAGATNEAQLEMEDWEFAPGRVTNDKEPAGNVAFSNSYLTSREPVAVSDDISFNVAVISSGSTIHLSVEDSKLRTCSVATGKVRVKIGNTEFKIGPHGMFKVMPGEDCKVENRHYMDAYIHCTTVDNYEVSG
ncbi:Cupin, RmlC-type [Sarocladium implicatum]|nr:Cupin, RmlC-type [Sarocladium implicatum]